MMATPTNHDSPHIMGLIKRNSVGAEIGVWKANTSILFLKRDVKKLYMVDPYSTTVFEYLGEEWMNEYYAKYSSVTGEFTQEGFNRYYDDVHKEVCEKVSSYEAAEVCRMTSDQWFEEYKGIELDWIYIDGDHSYEATLKDLNNSFKAVKKGGMILGDDYKWPDSKWWKDGTTKAVNEFIETNDLKMSRYGMTQFCIEI